MPTVTELAALWARSLEEIRDTLNDQRIFDSFLVDTSIDSIEGKNMKVLANTSLAAQILNSRYKQLITEAVARSTGTVFEIEFIDQPTRSKVEETPVEEAIFFKDNKLDGKYRFDNFVVGKSNREAYQASLMIAGAPGQLYNPLLVYGNSGLGKTHLLHALGNDAKSRFPRLNVLYISASDFVEEYVKFATGYRSEQSLVGFFKENVDVLLVDDIQYLVGKRGTMETFFTVFESLYTKGKQIVMTSDQHPNNLDGLDERLRTRFNQGLSLSMSAPDEMTSEQILKSKIKSSGNEQLTFDDDVIAFLAEKFSNNVRELEGALNRLFFYTINIRPSNHVTLEIATEALASLMSDRSIKTALSERKIIAMVAEYYSLSPSELLGKSRTGQVAMARHIAMYLCKEMMDMPYAKIGSVFGGKDHTTVMNGVRKVEKEVDENPGMKRAIDDLKARIKK